MLISRALPLVIPASFVGGGQLAGSFRLLAPRRKQTGANNKHRQTGSHGGAGERSVAGSTSAHSSLSSGRTFARAGVTRRTRSTGNWLPPPTGPAGWLAGKLAARAIQMKSARHNTLLEETESRSASLPKLRKRQRKRNTPKLIKPADA